jgi:hypothetical protein
MYGAALNAGMMMETVAGMMFVLQNATFGASTLKEEG